MFFLTYKLIFFDFLTRFDSISHQKRYLMKESNPRPAFKISGLLSGYVNDEVAKQLDLKIKNDAYNKMPKQNPNYVDSSTSTVEKPLYEDFCVGPTNSQVTSTKYVESSTIPRHFSITSTGTVSEIPINASTVIHINVHDEIARSTSEHVSFHTISTSTSQNSNSTTFKTELVSTKSSSNSESKPLNHSLLINNQIRVLLNKLVPDNLNEICKEFISITDDSFPYEYSNLITEFGFTDKLYSPLYAELTFTLVNEYHSSKNPFSSIILSEIYKKFKEMSTKTSTYNEFYFIGWLAHYELIDIKAIAGKATRLIKENQIDLFSALALPCGALLEKAAPYIYETLEVLVDDDYIPFRLRCIIAEHLILQSTQWKGHSFFLQRPVHKNEIPDFTNKYSKETQEGETILQMFIDEDQIPQKWTFKLLKSFILTLCRTSQTLFDEGLELIDLSYQSLKLTTIVSVFKDIISDQDPLIEIDFPLQMRRIGILMGIFLELNVFQITLFGSAIPFNLDVFRGLLEEASFNDNLLMLLKESSWFTELKFTPQVFSPLLLLSSISLSNMNHIWPVFQAMDSVLNLYLDQTDDNVLRSTLEKNSHFFNDDFFIKFAFELILMKKPKEEHKEMFKSIFISSMHIVENYAQEMKVNGWDDKRLKDGLEFINDCINN